MEEIFDEISGLIVQLKNIYFPTKHPFNDDQVLVQKLCVQLEKALRYGAREKYTFLGTRKDYWNYIADSIPKDEAVRFVQSLAEIKSNQGKGRALIRQALMEKTLADTLQRCVINERVSKEYYLVDSIIRNDQHFQSLIHLLYDLNAIDFNLPYKGYDLDRSWPSFSRKSFDENNLQRSTSIVSQQSSSEGDPLVILNAVVEGLLKLLGNWKGENYIPNDINNETNPITLQKIIELLLAANEDVIALKVKNESYIESLKLETDNYKQSCEKMKVDYEMQIKTIHDRYLILQKTDKTSDQLKDVFDKLLQTEIELNNTKTELDLYRKKNTGIELSKEQLQSENIILQKKLKELENEVKASETAFSKLMSENEELKQEISKLQSCETKVDIVDGDIIDKNDDNPEEGFINEMNVFIEDIICVLSEMSSDEEDHNNFDNEDGLFKKSKKKKLKKLKGNDNINPTNEIASKEEREAVLDKLVELKKEIIVSRQEKGDYQKEVIALKCELDTVSKDLNVLKEETVPTRQVHRHLTKEQETSTEPKPKQLNIAINTEIDPVELEKQKDIQLKCVELEEKLDKMTIEFEKCNEDMFNLSLNTSKLTQTIEDKDKEIETLQLENERIKDLLTHNNKLHDELVKVHEDLESSQKLNDNLKTEMQAIVEMKENEIKTMKFEMSTIEMKYEGIVKELAELTSKHNEALSDLSTHEEHLKLLETKQIEENSSWADEKDKLIIVKDELEKELENLKETLRVSDKEVKFLKLQVSKLAKEKEEDKDIKVNFTNRIQNLLEDRKKLESKFKEELNLLSTENSEMRDHVVNVTKDKHELWRKKEILEVELKSKGEERWVSDDEVKECTNCRQVFTITLRKHHCRLCGHIFCHSCSNRWIRTHHSRKRMRSCNVCADTYEDAHKDSIDGPDIVDGSFNDTMSDRSSFLGTDDFDESADLQKQISDDQLITDAFEILDPANVSSSGSFGTSEEIKIISTDIIQSPPQVPTVQSSSEDEIEKEILDISISAGQRYFVPIIVGGSQFQLIWEFNSTPKDVGFGIAWKANEEETDENIQTIIPLSRYISHKQSIHGKMMIINPGLYYLVFDNSFSRLTTKSVSCSIHLIRS